MHFRILFLLAVLLPACAAAAPRVVVSLPPVHSLTTVLMHGVGEPQLLLRAGQSPHGVQLQPSQRKMLADADLIVWVGGALEPRLAKIAKARGDAHSLALMEQDGITLLPAREGAHAHDHGEHADAHADEHAHEDEHGHEEHAHEEEHGHEEEHAHEDEHADEHADEHEHARTDPHIWLSVKNAQAIARIVARELARIDPQNRAQYERNLRALQKKITQLRRELQAQLRGLQDARYVVFHDAYAYFENEFGLRAPAVMRFNPEVAAGAAHVREVRNLIATENIRCIFSEPQFSPSMVRTLAEDSGVQSGVLDPLGAELQPGADAWFALMRALAGSLSNCLRG